VLNEKATSNLLKGEKIDLQMNGKTLLDVFLNELAQLKKDHESKDFSSGGGNPPSSQQMKIIVEHIGFQPLGP